MKRDRIGAETYRKAVRWLMSAAQPVTVRRMIDAGIVNNPTTGTAILRQMATEGFTVTPLTKGEYVITRSNRPLNWGDVWRMMR